MAAHGSRPSFAGTNIEHMGSDMDHKCREAAAAHEPQWANAGKAPGLQIWRIEQFVVVPWPEESYGQFHTGDSYIVLHTYHRNPRTTALAWDIYFWLGTESTQDEYGTAAYKTVELDDFLGGAPVQHREVQGFESESFLSLFPGGMIQILQGGVESGFNHVTPEEYQPRLLHLKGTANAVRVTQVELSRASLNSGDVFILDLGLRLFQFNGRASSGVERLKGAQLLRAINDERNGRPEAEILDEGTSIPADFWSPLGGAGPIKSAAEGGSDAAHASAGAAAGAAGCQLLRVSDASGTMTTTAVASAAKLAQAALDPNDVFIVDSGKVVFAWVGAGANRNEKREALGAAQRYLTTTSKPAYLPIERVTQGNENPQFRACFASWSPMASTVGGAAPAAAAAEIAAPDVTASHATFAKREFAGASGRLSSVDIADNSWMKANTSSACAGSKEAKKRDKKALKKQKKAEKKAAKGAKGDKKDKKDKKKK